MDGSVNDLRRGRRLLSNYFVNAETTDLPGGYLGYDARCGFCVAMISRARPMLLRKGIHVVPLQSAWAPSGFGFKGDKVLDEMKLLTAQGKVFGGADALVELLRLFWWAWPALLLTWIPGVPGLLRKGYRWIANHRTGFGCRVPSHHGASLARDEKLSAFYDLP